MSQKNTKIDNSLLFIISIIGIGLLVGIILSIYHSVCTRTLHRFWIRPLVGLFCGTFSSIMHIFLLRIINRLSKGAYENKPIFHAMQFTLILYVFLIISEFVFFAHKINEPSHKYWIFAASVLAFVISSFMFLYYRLIKMIVTRFRILEKLHMGIIESLVTVLEAKEPSKKGHSRRISEGCEIMAARYKLAAPSIEKLKRAALMHELGKIGVDDSILKKDSALDADELAQVRLHPLIAQKILAPLNILSWETEIIKASHIFINYADLKGKEQEEETPASFSHSIQALYQHTMHAERLEDLPLEARILTVVDFYDTLTHARPNRSILSKAEALQELKDGSGIRFDEKAVALLADVLDEGLWPSKAQEDAPLQENPPDEDEILREIRKTKKGLNLLNSFYQYMGIGRHRALRALILSLSSGLFMGTILGVIIYASSSDPIWFRLFIYQGLLVGLTVWSIGYPLEWLLARRNPDSPLAGPLGGFIGFFVAGFPAALLSLYCIIEPAQNRQFTIDAYDLMYLICTPLLCGGVGASYRYLQDSSFVLMRDQEKLQKAYFDLVCALSFALEALDPYTRGHSEKVSILSKTMGEKLKMGSEELEELERAALFHDIGKLGISQSIIKKTSRLSDEELAIIKTHPAIGAEILEPVTYFSELSPFVKAHHESFDGHGYPEMKEKEGIPLFARIIAIADSYDAMVSDRSYRKGLTHDVAIAELRKCSGTQFDPRLVELFIETLQHGEIKNPV
jgi:putative nucleotidyltransferase with HDIG domain